MPNISPIGESSFNMANVSADILTENFSGSSQDLTEAKEQAKRNINSSHKEADIQRDARIKELNKYATQLTKGGFFNSFLKVFSFVMKAFSPLTTLLDTVLGKVLKGKLGILRQIITFAVSIAQIFLTGGMSAFKNILDIAKQSLFKLITDIALSPLQKVLVAVANSLTELGQGLLQNEKQKNLATSQTNAEAHNLLATQAEKNLNKSEEQLRQIEQQMASLISTSQQTLNLNQDSTETLAHF